MSEPPIKPILQKPPGYRNPMNSPFKPPSRRPILPTSYPHSQKKKKNRSCGCCCATCLVLLVLILLTAVAGSVFYILFEPRIPVFHLQSVEFVKLNVTDSVDGPVLDSVAVVRIQVRNRNDVLKVNYGRTNVALSGGGVDLGKGAIPGFSQEKKNTTLLKLTTKVKHMLLESGGSSKKLRDGSKNRSLKMGTEVDTKVGVGFKGWNTIKLPIKAICEGVSLKDIDRGSSVPKCKITLFKLFNIKT